MFKDEKLTDENPSPLFQIDKMQSRIHVDISRIKATLPVEKGYGIPYHSVIAITPYARSFRRWFFAYHHAVNHPHKNIILS